VQQVADFAEFLAYSHEKIVSFFFKCKKVTARVVFSISYVKSDKWTENRRVRFLRTEMLSEIVNKRIVKSSGDCEFVKNSRNL
jgi:hypothetical protein